ncbi:HK97 gp10 family phage protein [Marinobacterium sp. MBR-111]|jgi:HK97 gp10 family phage protein|uniref:HK97-gp10 family putative phage morphogenesis protein n=1 Tax=Marinobacterium sp. MBR-111 TaxID=3156463 RepID=UPI0033984F6C
MAKATNYEVQGLRELEQALKDLGDQVGVKVLRSALRDAGKPTLERAKALAPVSDSAHKGYKGKVQQPGELKKALKIRTRLSRRNHSVFAFIGVRSKEAYYAQFVEFGTAPHYVTRGAKRSRGTKSGAKHRSKPRRMHPGAKPHPFLRPAWDQTKHSALDIFKSRIQHRLQLAQKRAAQRAAKAKLS